MTFLRFVLCVSCLALGFGMMAGAFWLASNPNTTDAAAFTYVILSGFFGAVPLLGAYELFAGQNRKPAVRRNRYRYCSSNN